MHNIDFHFLFSCEEAILGEEAPNTPSQNFEILWNDFDRHYSLFEVRGINWKQLYQIYRPQVTDDLSNEGLWEVMTEMVEHLDDSHTTLYNGNIRYKSGYALNEQSTAEFSAELLLSKYIATKTEVGSEDELLFGQVKDKNIGYIYLGTMDGDNPSVMDEIIRNFENTEAIILDIRQNSGEMTGIQQELLKPFLMEFMKYTVYRPEMEKDIMILMRRIYTTLNLMVTIHIPSLLLYLRTEKPSVQVKFSCYI